MKFEKITNLVQTFPEVCRYSCSQNGEVRNFDLYRKYYSLQIGKFNLKFFDSLNLHCQNCGWNSTIPGAFAKKVFKQGLKSNVLIRYAKNPILTSQFINLFGYLWRVWLVSLALLVLLIIFRFYSEPVIVSTPEVLTVDQAKSSKYINKIVKVEGVVDYPLALTKETEITQSNGETKLVAKEVYLPIFSQTDPSSFIVIRGGNEDLQKVLGRTGINNSDLLNNQQYSTTGVIQPIDKLENNDLKNFYLEELPKAKNLNPSTLLISSVGVISLESFLMRYASLTVTLILLLVLSVIVQVYIDRKIMLK